MSWDNLKLIDEKYYRDKSTRGFPFQLDDLIIYEDENHALIREYYRFTENDMERFDNKVMELFKTKKVVGINPSEFFNDERELFSKSPYRWYRCTNGPSNNRWDIFFQTKASIDSITHLYPNVFDIKVEPTYQSSYLGRRGTEKRFNFFRLCYEHKDKMLINYWNYHWRWQNVELCYFNEWNGIKFPYLTKQQQQDTLEQRKQNNYEYNAKLLFDAVNLQRESKFNFVLETYDSGPIITEKSILSFMAERIPVYTSEERNRKSFELLGFYLFDEIYDGYDVDKTLFFDNRGGVVIEPEVSWELNKEYYLQWKEIIEKVNSDWGTNYYKSKQDEIQHNVELCKKISDNTLYKSMGELFNEE